MHHLEVGALLTHTGHTVFVFGFKLPDILIMFLSLLFELFKYLQARPLTPFRYPCHHGREPLDLLPEWLYLCIHLLNHCKQLVISLGGLLRGVAATLLLGALTGPVGRVGVLRPMEEGL